MLRTIMLTCIRWSMTATSSDMRAFGPSKIPNARVSRSTRSHYLVNMTVRYLEKVGGNVPKRGHGLAPDKGIHLDR
jgi:hypothetical protein